MNDDKVIAFPIAKPPLSTADFPLPANLLEPLSERDRYRENSRKRTRTSGRNGVGQYGRGEEA